MKPASAPRTLALHLLTLAILSTPTAAQDDCPRASGPDAEAGWVAYSSNDIDGARARFAAALARCPDDHYARTGLGYVELRQARDSVAVWRLESIGAGAALRGGSAGSVSRRPAGISPPDPGAQQSDPADEAWLNGDTERALALYEARLERDPNDGVALHRVALMRAWAAEYDRAHELFDRLLTLEPENLDARVDRARVRAWEGETDRALEDLADLLEEHPDHPGALEARALFEAWAGRYEESLSSYEQVLAIAPDNPAARRQQAQVLAWASRFDASRAVYDSLLARNPNDVESRLGLATALSFSDDLEGAIAEYDRILADDPDHVVALQGKGRALGWADRLVEGEEVFRRAVAVDEANTASLVGLAQILRWQDRNAAALEVLERAAETAPTNSDVREQLRAVRLALDPVASPSFVREDDSDGNTMLTTSLSAGWHPTPRLDVRADAYRRDLDQRALGRWAMGVTLTARYQIEPGWMVTVGGGGSGTDGSGTTTHPAYHFGVTSPPRHPITFGLTFASAALDATALLAENGVTTTGGTANARWTPAPGWRLDAAAGRTRFSGTADNDRTNAFLSVSKGVASSITLGGSVRTFWFERDLAEGYFDPDFYGIGEVLGRWLRQAGAWTFLVELAPGMQKVTSDGDVTAAFRASTRIAYRVLPGREISLAGGYSSTGLQSFSTGDSDYRYTALIFGVNWVF